LDITSFNEACQLKQGHATEIGQLKESAIKDVQKLSLMLSRLKNVIIISTDGKTAEDLWQLPGVAPVCDYLNNVLKESGHMVISPYYPFKRERTCYDSFHLEGTTENAMLCWDVVRNAVMI